LKEANVEVVPFDLGKFETFDPAFEELSILSCFEHFSAHQETQEPYRTVVKVVEAAEKSGINHYVWSTLDSTKEFYDILDEADCVPRHNESSVLLERLR